MFEDAEFKRDRDAPEFKGTGRPGNDVESEESDEGEQSEQDSEADGPAKQTALNNLFGAKEEQEEAEEGGGEEALLSKMKSKERKKYLKNKAKDKITTKDAKVLMGGVNMSEGAEMIKKMSNKVSEKSKKIKKGSGANEITKQQVMEKLKSRRLAIPQSRFKS